MTRLYLFDFDGVLVDSLALYEAAVSDCLRALGSPPLSSRQEYLEIFEDNFYEGIRKRGVDVAAFMEVSLALAPFLDYGQVRPADGIGPVLEVLARRHTLLVVSSNSAGVIRGILARHGLEAVFTDVWGLEFMLSKVGKIRAAMARFGTGPGGTCYICDTTGDIVEAREAGVRTVGVAWGLHSRERLGAAGADVTIASPAELLLI
jgi:phosphoglycolate phosphatase